MNEDGKSVNLADLVYECCWENCDYQFEDMSDCIEHSVGEQTGHVQTFFANSRSGKFLLFIFIYKISTIYYVSVTF